MEVSGVAEPKEIKSTLRNEFYDVLQEFHKKNPVSPEIELEQMAAFENLPNDFDLDLKGRIEFKRKIDNEPEHKIPGVIDGEIFEQLVRSDPRLCPEPETLLGSQMRAVLADPERFDATKWIPGNRRQPDIAHFNVKNEVDYTTEVKLTHVGSHGADQLMSFRPNLKYAVDTLGAAKAGELRQHGLTAIADNKLSLSIAPDFKQRVVFSRGVYKKGDLNSVAGQFLDNDEKQRVRTILGTCTILESPFSVEEIHALRNHVMKKLGVAVGPDAGLPQT